MAVRLLKKARLPTKIPFTVVKTHEITKTTLDHVKRILTDHDYLKHPNLDEENNEKTSIVMEEEPHVDQKSVQSDMQGQSEACSIDNDKVAKLAETTNDGGIEASDLGSLLDKFEEAISNSPSILTPATSPGHSVNWSEPLSLKISSHEDATDLTPPTTPPIQEQPEQRCIHNNCETSTKHAIKKGSSQLNVKRNRMNKGKASEVKYTTVKKKCNTAVSLEVGTTEHSKQSIKLAEGKRKSNDTTSDTICGKKAKVQAENKLDESSENIGIQSNFDVGNVNKEKFSKVSKDEDMAVAKSNTSGEECDGEICSSEDIAAEEKSPIIKNNKVDTEAKQKNNHEVKELSNGKNCSVGVTEKVLPIIDSDKECEQNEVHNNNNNDIELKVNTCKNNDIRQIENSKNEKHLNDTRRDHNHESKYRDNEETSKRRTERLKEVSKDNRRKRRHSSRSASTDEDRSDEERLNSRKSERNHESGRHSNDSKRRKEKHREYSSRDDYGEERRHRRYDDDRRQRKPYVRDVERERKIDFRLGRSTIRDVAKEERRVIYVGGLPYGTTRDELWKRFRKFGPIEKITVHLRVGERDNYGFVTFLEPEDALVCIEQGNSDPTEPQFDLCFGGRRQFCGGSYVDFDSTTSHIEELSETYGKVCDDIPEEDDFDSLLRMCQEGLGR